MAEHPAAGVALLFAAPLILLGWIPVIGAPLGLIIGLILVFKYWDKVYSRTFF